MTSNPKMYSALFSNTFGEIFIDFTKANCIDFSAVKRFLPPLHAQHVGKTHSAAFSGYDVIEIL